MSKLLKAVDERTTLAGANRLEVLMFSLGKDQQIRSPGLAMPRFAGLVV